MNKVKLVAVDIAGTKPCSIENNGLKRLESCLVIIPSNNIDKALLVAIGLYLRTSLWLPFL